MTYTKRDDIEDFTYFRNRISFRMRDLGIHSTKALSIKLQETGFFKRIDSNGNIHLLKASSINKTVQKHLQYNIPNELPDSLTANHVQAYVKVLNCSADFILGNSNTISNNVYTRDLCNRTGLSENAISNFLKMTDDRFAFRTLRVSSDEARKILNSLLTMPELASFIKSLNNIHYEFCAKPTNSFDKLKSTLGIDRITTALKWDKILDPLYDGESPSESELEDVFLVRNAMNEDYEAQSKILRNKQFAKYQLIKNFQSIIDHIYPD